MAAEIGYVTVRNLKKKRNKKMQVLRIQRMEAASN
jgi:hypothetical protein